MTLEGHPGHPEGCMCPRCDIDPGVLGLDPDGHRQDKTDIGWVDWWGD